MIREKIVCPACKNKDCTYVSEFSYTQDGRGFFANSFNVLECQTCKLWFKDSIPSKETIKAFYQSLSSEGSEWNYEYRLPHERRIDKVLKELDENSKVLDVGCWTGRLLSTHPHLKRFGIEPNEHSGKIAEKRGITILGENVSNEALNNQRFDVITLIDVFEHLDSPLEIIEILISHLNNNGKLIIVTGASDSFAVKLAGITYWYFSKIPDHIVFLNRNFINWLRTRVNNTSIAYRRISHYNRAPKKLIKEMMWLFIWRFLNPNSPFVQNKFQKAISLKRFKNLKEVIICSNQKDHLLVTFTKNS